MSLWSFEGCVREAHAIHFTISGGHSGGGTPLPIPNREVKPASADGTRRATSRESRSPPNYFENGPRKRPVSVLGDYAAWRAASPAISPTAASTYRAARSS